MRKGSSDQTDHILNLFGPIDASSTLPRYLQVIGAIELAIRQGLLPLGSRLPIEDQLCSAFQVSRTTIRQAIGTLVEKGVIERKHGSGTWISAVPPVDHLAGMRSLYEEISAGGKSPETQVLEFEQILTDMEFAKLSGFREGTRLHAVTRLRFADGQAVAFVRNWVPYGLITLTADRLPGESMEAMLRANGIIPHSVHQRLVARFPSPEEAAILRIDHIPALNSCIWARDRDGELLCFSDILFHPANYTFETTSYRQEEI